MPAFGRPAGTLRPPCADGVMSLVRRLFGLTTRWFDVVLVRRPAGPMAHWSNDSLVRRAKFCKPVGPVALKARWSNGPLVCICVRMYECIHVCMYLCCMYVYIYVCMCMYVKLLICMCVRK